MGVRQPRSIRQIIPWEKPALFKNAVPHPGQMLAIVRGLEFGEILGLEFAHLGAGPNCVSANRKRIEPVRLAQDGLGQNGATGVQAISEATLHAYTIKEFAECVGKIRDRRRAGQAEALWESAGRTWVPDYDDCSILVAQPGGQARLQRVGLSVQASFGLVPESRLERHDPLSVELCAACDLIALQPVPLHFEISLATPEAACILLRGVALPIAGADQVQIVMSWREVLNRSATARLRRDLVAALRQSGPRSMTFDPFSSDFGKMPGA